VGDIILEVNRSRIRKTADLFGLLAQKRAGDPVHLKIRRQGRTVDVDGVLTPFPSADDARLRRSSRRWCTVMTCPACQGDLAALDRPANPACEACLRQSASEIAVCQEAFRPAAPPPSAKADVAPAIEIALPAANPAAPLTALVLNGLTLAPAVVAPGENFVIEVSYGSPSVTPVTFAFTISAGGKELLSSKAESIAGTNGAPLTYRRTVRAGADPGAYVVRVTLGQEGQFAGREVALTVRPK
jgi:hypothetical protein